MEAGMAGVDCDDAIVAASRSFHFESTDDEFEDELIVGFVATVDSGVEGS